jgi:hypothetical protein
MFVDSFRIFDWLFVIFDYKLFECLYKITLNCEKRLQNSFLQFSSLSLVSIHE